MGSNSKDHGRIERLLSEMIRITWTAVGFAKHEIIGLNEARLLVMREEYLNERKINLARITAMSRRSTVPSRRRDRLSFRGDRRRRFAAYS